MYYDLKNYRKVLFALESSISIYKFCKIDYSILLLKKRKSNEALFFWHLPHDNYAKEFILLLL